MAVPFWQRPRYGRGRQIQRVRWAFSLLHRSCLAAVRALPGPAGQICRACRRSADGRAGPAQQGERPGGGGRSQHERDVSGRAPVTAASSSALAAISRPEPIKVARRWLRTVTPAVKLPAAPARPNPSSTSHRGAPGLLADQADRGPGPGHPEPAHAHSHHGAGREHHPDARPQAGDHVGDQDQRAQADQHPAPLQTGRAQGQQRRGDRGPRRPARPPSALRSRSRRAAAR
jgi:hypothetical protein